jgi:hypothetical protein
LGDELAGVADEQLDDLPFGRREVDFALGGGDPLGSQVDREVLRLHDRFFVGRCGAPQCRPQAVVRSRRTPSRRRVCAYLSLALLVGIGLNIAAAGGGPTRSPPSQMLPVIVWQGWETLEEARVKQSEDQ